MPTPRINPADPFAVTLSPAQRDTLGLWLSREIEAARDARAAIIERGGLIDYAHFQYEQGRLPQTERRWPGAADLPSWLPTEKVDALRSRVMKTIFAEPFSIVEGWGPDAQKAPFIEAFHEWKRKDERLRGYLSKALHNALVEGNGVLEVTEDQEIRLQRAVNPYAAQTAPDGSVLLNEQNQPQPQVNDQGAPQPADQPEQQPTVQTATATYTRVRSGPGYRVLSLRDFLFLPGHAAQKSDLFGMFKRTYLSVDRITELIEFGVYDEDALQAIGTASDRSDMSPTLERQGMSLAPQQDGTAEKELWSGLLLYDCDGDGIAEWYVATVHLQSRTLLRIRHDDLHMPRFVVFTPFPRSDSVYGYSFVLDKLGTTTEEHTAVRNMKADRMTIATNPPLKRRQGALYDPEEQPFGTGQVIDVRDMDEIQPMLIPDVPASAAEHEAILLQAAERLTGVNDTAVGVQAQERRTATEVQNVAVAGAVRTEEIVENIQEDLEQLDMIRHQLWIRALEAQPDGIPAPETLVQALSTRELQLPNGQFTASMLQGNIRFKPHGSVETADKDQMRGDFNGALTALAGLAKITPLAAAMLQDPGVIKAIVQQVLRLYNVPDQQPFLVGLQHAMAQLQQAQQEQAQQAQGAAGQRVIESLNYKDAPDDIKRQIEQQAGLHPSQIPPGMPGSAGTGGAPPPGSGSGVPEPDLMTAIAHRAPQVLALLRAHQPTRVQ